MNGRLSGSGIMSARWLERPVTAVIASPQPCRVAGGEEPYSIAMTFQDLGLPARRFEIDAIDISDRRLAIARRGVYSLTRSAVPASVTGRVISSTPQGYELIPAVRSLVRFLQASVVEPGLLEARVPYDIVFCRNLLIYLSDTARASVFAAIDRLLAADGFVVIGHADRLDAPG